MMNFLEFCENMSTAAMASSISNPPGPSSKMAFIRRKKVKGCDVFVADSDRYNKCRAEKMRNEK